MSADTAPPKGTPMRTTASRLLAAGAALALAVPAFAQAPADPADPVIAEEPAAEGETIIVTAQRNNQTEVTREGDLGVLGNKAAEDIPFSIKSYNSALILNQQPTSLGQVLENDPSIRTTFGFGNAAELFVIRGFPLYGDDIAFNGLYGISPRQLVAPELYEQVQVLNGASAFLNGAAPGGSAIGGNVNLVSKRAGQRDLFRATANYLSNEHFGGSLDASRRFGADGALGIRINGAFRTGEVAIDNEDRRAAVIGAGIDWSSGPLRLAADLAYQRYDVYGLRPKVTVSTAVPEVPDADHNYAQGFTYTRLRDIFGSARLEYDLADNALFYITGGMRDGDERGVYDGITITDAATGAARGGPSYIPYVSNNEAVQGGLRVKLAGSGISHEINIGGSHIWQVGRTAYDFRTGYDTNLYDTPAVALPGTTLFAGGDLDDPYPITRTRLGSAFASDTIGLFDDRLLITGGLRLQTINVKGYSYFGGDLATSYDEDAVTPVVGIVVKPADGISLYANRIEALSQGEVAPTGVTYPGIGSLPVSNAGEVFSPFKSVQYEVGAKAALGRFNASVALFQTQRPTGRGTLDPGNASVSYAIDGEQRHRGIELSVDGEIARGLRLIAGGSIIDAELRDTLGGQFDGNTARGVPEYTANANIEWDVPFVPGFTLTGRVVQTGGQAVNDANTLEIGDWTRFDLGARYVALLAEQPVTFRFGVDNVLNERYWSSAFDAFGSALLQGQPRTFRLSASLDLQ